VLEALDDGRQGDSGLQAREHAAEAEVMPETERQVPIRIPSQIQGVRICEHALIPVRRDDHGKDRRAFRDDDIADLHILGGNTRCGSSDRGGESQEFFHG